MKLGNLVLIYSKESWACY